MNGVLCPRDLVNNNCHIMSRVELAHYYHSSLDFLSYHHLYICLKKYIQTYNLKPQAYQRPVFLIQIQLLSKSKKGTRDFYKVLIKKGNTQDNYFKKWKEDLDISFNLACEKNIFRNCFFSIQDNSLIWFQYKLIHRLTATNAYLYKIGLSETPVCRLCNKYEETIVHLFVSCQRSINFWMDVKFWLSKICLFGVLRRFQHCTGHITTGSWKGRGNQYI